MSNYSFVDAVKDALKGDFADKSSSEVRYKICQACPLFDHKMFTCGSCGCFMPAKTKLKNATCPEGHW